MRSVSCAESRGRRIDRRQPVGQRRAVADDLELRMHDLEAEVAGAHVAEHAHALARLQRLLLARIEREEAQHELRARGASGSAISADELPPRPVLDLGAHDHALGLHGEARLQARERHEARVVLVAQRQVQDEVCVARDAEPRELVGEAARPRARRLRGFAGRRASAERSSRRSGRGRRRAAAAGQRQDEDRLDLDQRAARQCRDLVGGARRIRLA